MITLYTKTYIYNYFYLESPVKGSQNTPKKETKNEKCSKERIKPSYKPRPISRRNRSKVINFYCQHNRFRIIDIYIILQPF